MFSNYKDFILRKNENEQLVATWNKVDSSITLTFYWHDRETESLVTSVDELTKLLEDIEDYPERV